MLSIKPLRVQVRMCRDLLYLSYIPSRNHLAGISFYFWFSFTFLKCLSQLKQLERTIKSKGNILTEINQ